MPGIIEDHEARLKILEEVRRGINTEITNQITAFSATLEGQSRRLTLMEANHTGLQHDEIEAIGRRVHQVEVNTVATLDSIAQTQAALGEDVRAWVDELKNSINAEITLTRNEFRASLQNTIFKIEATDGRVIAAMEAQRVRFHDRTKKLEDWHARQTAWDALPWWKRWWKRLRGERP